MLELQVIFVITWSGVPGAESHLLWPAPHAKDVCIFVLSKHKGKRTEPGIEEGEAAQVQDRWTENRFISLRPSVKKGHYGLTLQP